MRRSCGQLAGKHQKHSSFYDLLSLSLPGPPWPVTPELYKQLLLPAGFELLSLERIPDRLSHPKRVGREWLGRWRYTGAGAGDAAQE